MWDRFRVDLSNQPFSVIDAHLFPILSQRNLRRACIDKTSIGIDLCERAKLRFGYKVEPHNFTPALKEELAFGLRRDLEDRKLRLVRDDKLRGDLHALRKEVTHSGNIRLDGESDDSHCDRTWAKALRQYAARARAVLTSRLG
jgi:phage FluMu gp28-like protein